MAKRRETIVKTLKEVGSHFGISYDQVKTWKRNGMPCHSDGYCLEDIRKWKESRRKDKSPELSPQRQQLLEAQIEQEQARAAMLKRKNQLEEGQFVDIRDVEQFISEFNSFTRHQFTRLAPEFSSNFPKDTRHDLTQLLQDQIQLRLKAMAEWQTKVTRRLGGDA